MSHPQPKALDAALDAVIKTGASDLHIDHDQEPVIRVHGRLREAGVGPVQLKALEQFLQSVLTPRALTDLESHGDIDFAFSYAGRRFRASAYRTGEGLALAVRVLSEKIPSPSELGIPPVVQSWAQRDTGLIIVTGPTGSGKSTTVASLVNEANQSRAAHILTVEDPVEYVLPSGMARVHQREIGRHSPSFPRAVRAALREDVDILVIGEMRDLETIDAALTVAETGHLVFATLHTHGAPDAIDRITSVFQPQQQQLIATRLAASLVGVIYQRLITSADLGRVAAHEVLVANTAVRNLIREGKTHHLPNVMLTSASEGMTTMAKSVAALLAQGVITPEIAEQFLQQNR